MLLLLDKLIATESYNMKEIIIAVVKKCEELWANNNTGEHGLVVSENTKPDFLIEPNNADEPADAEPFRLSAIRYRDLGIKEVDVNALRMQLERIKGILAKQNRFYKLVGGQDQVTIELLQSWGPIMINKFLDPNDNSDCDQDGKLGRMLNCMATMVLTPEAFERSHKGCAPGKLTVEIMKQNLIFNRSAIHRRLSPGLKHSLDECLARLCGQGSLTLLSENQIEQGLRSILNQPELRFTSKAKFYRFADFEKCAALASSAKAKEFFNSQIKVKD